MTQIFVKSKFFLTLIFALFFAISSQASTSLIRDAETEKFLHEIADPIFAAANLEAKNINIYIVNDEEINAFVSGGQNVFINTGLIRKYKTPDALIGVIAHETGHIAAGHIARSSEEMKDANNTMLLSYLLGIGALIGGAPDAGQAILLGGSQAAERLFLKYTRGQEEAADRHAAKYLIKLQYPADGLVELLEFFNHEMIGYQGKIDEYALTHPVSKKRIEYLQSNFAHIKFSDKEWNKKLQPRMDIVLAKLEAFIDDPEFLLKKYKNRDDDIAKYVRAVALHRKGKSPQGLKLLDEVIAKNGQDGFLYELKAQILFESGDISNAVLAYNKAISLLEPRDSASIKISFALAILTLSTNDYSLIDIALKRLKEAKVFESENPFLYREFASAYNKNGDEARSLLALAEYNFLTGDKEKTRKYAKLAQDKFAQAKNKDAIKADLIRIDDLLELAKDDKKTQ